jgi:hypothetical protein
MEVDTEDGDGVDTKEVVVVVVVDTEDGDDPIPDLLSKGRLTSFPSKSCPSCKSFVFLSGEYSI